MLQCSSIGEYWDLGRQLQGQCAEKSWNWLSMALKRDLNPGQFLAVRDTSPILSIHLPYSTNSDIQKLYIKHYKTISTYINYMNPHVGWSIIPNFLKAPNWGRSLLTTIVQDACPSAAIVVVLLPSLIFLRRSETPRGWPGSSSVKRMVQSPTKVW